MHKVLKSLGARIRAEREWLGISQEELADRCGLHRTYIGSVERGQRRIEAELAVDVSQELATALGKGT